MSIFKVFDRVKEVATTTGTGTFTLANTVQAGYLRFSDIPGIATGNIVPYCAVDATASPVAWEVGYGTYTASGTTLARTSITSNSLGTTAAIGFAAAPAVFLDYTSGMALASATPKLYTGRFYLTPGTISASSGNPTPNKICMTPFFVPNPLTLTSYSFTLGGTVGTGTVYIGIATDNEGQPSTLLSQASQAVTSANANATLTVSTTQFLAPGMYWVVVGTSSTFNSVVYQNAASQTYGTQGLGNLPSSTAAGALAQSQLGYTSTDAIGTLPTTFTGLAPNPGTSTPMAVALGF